MKKSRRHHYSSRSSKHRYHNTSKKSRHHKGDRKKTPEAQMPNAEEKFLKHYEQFIDRHTKARKRYFQQYYFSSNPPRRRKLEEAFFDSVESLRRFESSLSEKKWEIVEKKKRKTYREDHLYSHNHKLDPSHREKMDEEKESWTDPSLNPTQLNRKSYKNDREVSTGTMEDYHRYRTK